MQRYFCLTPAQFCKSKRNIHIHKYRLTKKSEISCIQFPLYVYMHAQRHMPKFHPAYAVTDLNPVDRFTRLTEFSSYICQNYFWSLRWLVSVHDSEFTHSYQKNSLRCRCPYLISQHWMYYIIGIIREIRSAWEKSLRNVETSIKMQVCNNYTPYPKISGKLRLL